MIGGDHQHWGQHAVCHRETPDTPELWTPERRPVAKVWPHLQQMCQRCPVRQRCAQEAVHNGDQCGIYAGVFVPDRRNEVRWDEAMAALRGIAGQPDMQEWRHSA